MVRFSSVTKTPNKSINSFFLSLYDFFAFFLRFFANFLRFRFFIKPLIVLVLRYFYACREQFRFDDYHSIPSSMFRNFLTLLTEQFHRRANVCPERINSPLSTLNILPLMAKLLRS